MNTLARYQGCLLGLACGDAVGTTVEFEPRGSFPPVTDMIGKGPFGLAAGQWTDDTSMALCLAESLLACGGFDARDQMTRYLRWWREGYLSSTDSCVDIGATVAGALQRFSMDGEPFSGLPDAHMAGNGSLMRLAPVVMFYFPAFQDVFDYSALSSRTTHAAPEATECCQLLGWLLMRALSGDPKAKVLAPCGFRPEQPRVALVARGDFMRKSRDEVRGSGYCVRSLEAALWCFHTTTSFESAVLAAANLGDDADTTAAITGQLAGAYYGVDAIPGPWLAKLYMRREIEDIAGRLYDASRTR